MTREFASGWRVLLGSFLGVAIGASSLYFYSLGLFIQPMQEAFGWSRAEASLGALVGTACAALMATPTGWLADRIGSARVAIGSLLLLALGFATLAYATVDLASFLAVTALLSLATTGSTPLPFTRLVVNAFQRNRGIALGIVLTGTGLGAILIPRLLGPFIAEVGWRAGYLTLAVVVAVATPIVAMLLLGAKETRANVRTGASSQAKVLAHRAFYILAPIFFVAATSVLGTVVHFVPMLRDAGLTPARAGAIASLIGFAAIGGRLVTGLMLDRFPVKWIAALLFALASLGFFVLAYGGLAAAPAGAIVAGFAIGAEVDLLAFLISRHFHGAIYGRAYGAIYAMFLVGGALGPYVAGQMYDLTGGYTLWLSLAGASLVCAALLSLALPRQPGAPV